MSSKITLVISNPCGFFLRLEEEMPEQVRHDSRDGALRGAPAERVESNEVRTRERLLPLEPTQYFFNFS